MRIVTCLLALLLAAAPARASQGQIYLTWDDCDKDGAGLHDTSIACLTNDGASYLYCAFKLSEAVSDVIGIVVTVDMQHSLGTLPDWWEIQGEGQCRDGQLHVSGDYTQNSVCADPWHNLGEGTTAYYPQVSEGRMRILGTYAVRSDSARSLAADTFYYGLTIVIGNERTVFPAECAGCNKPACLVLNNIRLLRGPDSVPVEVTIDDPGAPGSNHVAWVGGAGADCSAVPVRASTWGRLKSLYR